MDVSAVRADTLIERGRIHFDNAGASLTPAVVHRAMVDHLELERAVGGYAAKERVEKELSSFYTGFATLLGCDPTEVAFAENATRAWDVLVYSMPFSNGGRILTGSSEYVSNYLALLQLQDRFGLRVEVVPNDETGRVSLDDLERLIDDDVQLVAFTHIATSNGGIEPAAEIGRIAHDAGIPFLLDACQSAGQIAIDVKEIGCDMLTGTGRKFLRGPRGTGFLYVRREFAEKMSPVFIDVRSADWVARDQFRLKPGAERFECWETSIAGRLGLSAAVDYALQVGMHDIEASVRTLGAHLRRSLRATDGVEVVDAGNELSGIVAFHCRSMSSFDLRQELSKRGVAISAIATADARLDLEPHSVTDIARASVHYFNTEEEVEQFTCILDEVLRAS